MHPDPARNIHNKHDMPGRSTLVFTARPPGMFLSSCPPALEFMFSWSLARHTRHRDPFLLWNITLHTIRCSNLEYPSIPQPTLILFQFALCFALLSSALLLFSTPHYCTVLYYTLLYSVLFYSIPVPYIFGLCESTLIYSVYSTLLYSTLLYSTLIYSTLYSRLLT